MEQLSLFEFESTSKTEAQPIQVWSKLEPQLQNRATEALARIFWSALIAAKSTTEVSDDNASKDF